MLEKFREMKDLLDDTTPPPVAEPHKRKPLTDEQIEAINVSFAGKRDLARMFARAVEAAHGIKEKNTSNGGCL